MTQRGNNRHMDVTLAKPRLRGVSHELAFFAALGAGAVLIALSPPRAAITAAVYAVSLATMLGVSALYHRPNWSPGANRRSAMRNVPLGYYFNPGAFAIASVQPGQSIPSAHDPTAITSEGGTDFGNVGRNVLRGPSQSNVDFSLGKRFPLSESKVLEFRADFFNLFNHSNRDNPISDISTGDFGKVLSFSSSPRIVQLSLKFNF